MAVDSNNVQSFVKFQALVRGYFVRKKFSRLKYEYEEFVRSVEDDLRVSWKDKQLCLPRVFRRCSDTRGRSSVLSHKERQKTFPTTPKSNPDSESKVETILNGTKSSDGIQIQSQRSTNGSTSDEKRTNNNLDSLVRNSSVLADDDEMVKNSNSVATERTLSKKTENPAQTEFVAEKNGNEKSGKSDEILYPNNKSSLIKLREDLTMELLWIEQAIDSRINYLALKENLANQGH